jgi:hypothetical protein
VTWTETVHPHSQQFCEGGGQGFRHSLRENNCNPQAWILRGAMWGLVMNSELRVNPLPAERFGWLSSVAKNFPPGGA